MAFLSHAQHYLQLIIPLGVIVFTYYTWRTKIPLVPSQKAARKVVLDVVRAAVQENPNRKLKIYDLGAGLGGLALALGKTFPDAEVVGMEMAWPTWLFAFIRQKLSLRKNVRFLYGDFWKHDISDGNVIVFYLGYIVMQDMSDKLRREPCADRLIISNNFALPSDWTPAQRIAIDTWLSKEVLVYRQN